ncbi:response regulator [Modestobacter muralis]|uniref:Response regulator n=1 Tax=Modestobacter muralis TaxID=1608614 RepID=A0A6P0EM56_9ACTN|nr:HD domain-containing phosphohydrolase [Modestobacter muralis]NEK92811.1 response regulator [Modestobacter muralis]NEN49578.1 response regulator [Modestobacter muralis]
MPNPTVSSVAPATPPASILLVDDEVAILDGLRRQLRREYTVHTATGGAAALEILAAQQVTVVVSDMRMPEMDGATFLSKVRTRHPDVGRVLLTGQADTQAAIAAVNQGHVFRFLTKPCPPDVLMDAIGSAVEIHRLATAEKELMASTLRRTVEAFIATLGLAQPVAFARSQRITRTATEVAEALGVEDVWEVEVAAMLAALGSVSLPASVQVKIDSGRPLDPDEAAMQARVPHLSRDLVSAIPRLEAVGAAIGWQRARYDGVGNGPGVPGGEDLPLVTRILKVAVDFEQGRATRPSVQDTIAVLQADAGSHDPAVLAALARCHGAGHDPEQARVVGIGELEEGMLVFDDIRTAGGVLLVGRGTTVTAPLVQRLENFAAREPLAGPILVTGGAA